MQYLKSFLALGSLAVANGLYGGPQAESKVSYSVAIYYYPLTQTACEGMDQNQIEYAYDVTSVLKTETADLIRLLRKGDGEPGNFDPHQLRLKVVPEDGAVILLDVFGNVKVGESYQHVSTETLARIRSLIRGSLPPN